MSNQDKSSFQLNPSANEFVPTGFGAPPQQQQQQPQPYQRSYNNHPNSHKNYNNNNNHRQNNQYHYNNNRNNHHHNNNYYHHNNNHYNNNHYSNQYYSNNNNQTDVDPIEIEARCEAVIEILQDDNIRNHLNPVKSTDNEQLTNQISNNSNDDDQGCDDEELLEMMAMQEECRLEMMKFYIQSQNPNLFEEIYHDVSYPEANKPVEPLNELKPKSEANKDKVEAKAASSTENDKKEAQPKPEQNKSEENKNTTEEDDEALKEMLINKLNPTAYEFVPTKFSSLSLEEKEEKK